MLMRTRVLSNRKTARRIKGWWIVLCIVGLVFMVGCDGNVLEGVSDDDSYEARKEEGLMALDDEDYGKAIKLFSRLRKDYPDKQEVCVYLSNAFAGLTGIDTLNLLETIDELDASGDDGSIDMIGLLLGDADGLITLQSAADKSTSIESAKSFFGLDSCISDPNTDEQVQLGILGLADIALILADVVLEDTGADSVELTEDALADLYQGSSPDFTVSLEQLALLNQSMADLQNSIDVLDELFDEDDLSDDFDAFLNKLDPDGNGVLTEEELETYVDSL